MERVACTAWFDGNVGEPGLKKQIRRGLGLMQPGLIAAGINCPVANNGID